MTDRVAEFRRRAAAAGRPAWVEASGLAIAALFALMTTIAWLADGHAPNSSARVLEAITLGLLTVIFAKSAFDALSGNGLTLGLPLGATVLMLWGSGAPQPIGFFAYSIGGVSSLLQFAYPVILVTAAVGTVLQGVLSPSETEKESGFSTAVGRLRARIGTGLGSGQSKTTRIALVLLLAVVAMDYAQFQSGGASLAVAYLAEVYILLALGLNVVVGFAGLLDLGYAAFFAIGAYTGALLASPHFMIGNHTFSNSIFSLGPGGIHINFFLLIPLAALIAAFFGITFGAPTLRLRGDYLAIVTLGFGEIVPNVVKNLGLGNGIFIGRNGSGAMPNLTNGVNSIVGIDSPPSVSIFGWNWSFSGLDLRPWYYLALIVIAISIVLVTRLRDSRLGRSWAAMREDEIAASHAGVNITGTRLTAFAIGASFSGFGGLLYASQLGSVSYQFFTFSVSVTILVMVILGGMGSIPGVILGGIIIAYLSQTWLDSLSVQVNTYGHNLRPWVWPFGGHLNLGSFHLGSIGTWMGAVPLESARPMVYGLILVGIMLLRPQGLWPSRRRARELHPETQGEADAENLDLHTVATGEI